MDLLHLKTIKIEKPIIQSITLNDLFQKMKIGKVMNFNKRKKKRQKHNERKEKNMSSCKSPVYLAL